MSDVQPRLAIRIVRKLAAKAGAATLEAIADVVVEAFEASPQLQLLVSRKVYQRSVQHFLGMHPEFRPRVVEQAPMFAASALSKCSDPGCDICRPRRSGMAN